LRAAELSNNLLYLTRETGLQILPGNKVLEIKNAEVNKGKAALNYIQSNQFDFIVAIGDDYTDEDIFTNLPNDAITIKVGPQVVTAAKYYLKTVSDVRHFLTYLTTE
jgi:trehalose 6-phosphate synthase/phosphatase